MKAFAVRHPVLFEILLFIAGLAIALAVGVALQIIAVPNEDGLAIGRIIAGIVLYFLFRYCFREGHPFAGAVLILPALLFALWNLFYNFSAGMKFAAPGLSVIIGAVAPAVFEEVIFRGIAIWHLQESGRSDLQTVLISALVFGLVHMTNIVGGDIAGTLLQTGYAVVIGLVFGAVYVRTKDLPSLIIVHALIDLSGRLFESSASTSTPLMLAIFITLMAAEAVYAVSIINRTNR